MSFSDSAGTDTATPGRLMPLWLLTLPPTSTSVTHVGAVLDLGDPQPDLAVVDEDRVADARRRRARPLYVVPQISASPSTSRVVIVHRWPRVQLDRAVGEGLQPDLRALEVGEDARRRGPLASEASRTSR